MGTWFSNLHIRKNSTLTQSDISEYIRNMMAAQEYLPADSVAEADGAFAIVSDDECPWYSVYSDLFAFDEPKTFADYALPMSEKLKTDILGMACFDSDFMYLNLLNAESKLDAWVSAGSAMGMGIRRRSNLSAWKGKVDDFDKFKAKAKEKYDCAEDFLADIESCIRLPAARGEASYEHLEDMELEARAAYLYFKLPEGRNEQALPKLVQKRWSGMPCFLGKPALISAVNVGGASKGLTVYFVGPYVEHDEITFPEVCFVKLKGNSVVFEPFELKKTQLFDEQWVYYYHDPAYRIPPKVDERLPEIKKMRLEDERGIVVRFVPQGNPRKILDITVVLVPDKNHQGQTGWNSWYRFGSKEAFIEHHNKNWSKHPNCEDILLRKEDLD